MTMSIRALLFVVLPAMLVGAPCGDARADGVLQALRTLAVPLRDAADLGPLVDAGGKVRVVLLGEASHGTHEFQRLRRVPLPRLIARLGLDSYMDTPDLVDLEVPPVPASAPHAV